MQRIVSSLLILTLSALGYSPMVFALGKRSVSADIAEKGFTVQLSRGAGVVINLSGIGESISKIWLSDPSKMVYSAQGQVLYLKPIHTLDFPGNYHASDGSSLLTVVTQSGKVYQFRLVITSGSSYTALDITPARSFENYPSVTSYNPTPKRRFNRSTVSKAIAPTPFAPKPSTVAQQVTSIPPVSPVAPPSVPKTSGPLVPSPFVTDSSTTFQLPSTVATKPTPKTQVKPDVTFESQLPEPAPVETPKPTPTETPKPQAETPPKSESKAEIKTQVKPTPKKTPKAKPSSIQQTPKVKPTETVQKPAAPSPETQPQLTPSQRALADANGQPSPESATPPTPPEEKQTSTPAKALEQPPVPKIQSVTGNPHAIANALVRGLAIANRTKEISYTSPISFRVQNTVRLLRRGTSLNKATEDSRLPQKTITRLLQLGNYQQKLAQF
jgi:hypothetical protein